MCISITHIIIILHPTRPPKTSDLPPYPTPPPSSSFLLFLLHPHSPRRPTHSPCITPIHRPRGARRRTSHHRDLRPVVPTRSHPHPLPYSALLSVHHHPSHSPLRASPHTAHPINHVGQSAAQRSLHHAAPRTPRCTRESAIPGPPSAYRPVVSIPINARSVTSTRPQPNPISPPLHLECSPRRLGATRLTHSPP